MKRVFKIEATDKKVYANGDVGAGDTIMWEARTTLKAAKNLAERLFKSDKEVYSIWIEREDVDGELCFQISKYRDDDEWRSSGL